MTLTVEVIGVSPACLRCKRTEENAKRVVAKLEAEGVKVEVVKLNVTDKGTISKYGVVATPALAINGVVRIMGKELGAGVIERLLRKEL